MNQEPEKSTVYSSFSDDIDGHHESHPLATDPPGRQDAWGLTWLSWLVIIAIVTFIVWGHQRAGNQQSESTEASAGSLLMASLPGKFTIALNEFSKTPGAEEFKPQVLESLESLNAGAIEQRYCYAILLEELEGPDASLDYLDQLRIKTAQAKVEYSEKQERLETMLIRMFESRKANQDPEWSDQEKQYLISSLGWCGKWAAHPDSDNTGIRQGLRERAKLMVLVAIGAIITAIILTLVGTISFFVFLAKGLNGSLVHRVADRCQYSAIYVETFAIWILMFAGVSIAASFLRIDDSGIATTAMLICLPMLCMVWPLVRGVPWANMKQDLGLQLGNPLVEVAAGIAAWLAMLPVLIIGLIGTVTVIYLMGPSQGGSGNEFTSIPISHPIINMAVEGSVLQVIFSVLLMVSILAPLTEETLFRGMLYRHLRDASRWFSRWPSILVSAFVSSIIFAAIHPQGLFAIPMLATLGFAFCLVRQWRGSLVAPMVMHAIHNAAVTSGLLLVVI